MKRLVMLILCAFSLLSLGVTAFALDLLPGAPNYIDTPSEVVEPPSVVEPPPVVESLPAVESLPEVSAGESVSSSMETTSSEVPTTSSNPAATDSSSAPSDRVEGIVSVPDPVSSTEQVAEVSPPQLVDSESFYTVSSFLLGALLGGLLIFIMLHRL